MRRLLAMCLATILAGCGDITTSSHTDFPIEEVVHFVPHATTKADVIAKLGKPGAVDQKSFGEMWTYAQTDSKIPQFSLKSEMKQKIAFISFQGDKLLTATWTISDNEAGAGGGGTKIVGADIQALKDRGPVTREVIRQRFGEPQQRIWQLTGAQQWGYIAVGFAGNNPKYTRFDFDPDGTLNKVELLEK